MTSSSEKYNDTKARYAARLILQKKHNKNRGLDYRQAVKLNPGRQRNIDFWLSVLEKDEISREDYYGSRIDKRIYRPSVADYIADAVGDRNGTEKEPGEK